MECPCVLEAINVTRIDLLQRREAAGTGIAAIHGPIVLAGEQAGRKSTDEEDALVHRNYQFIRIVFREAIAVVFWRRNRSGGYTFLWTGMKVLKHDGLRHHGLGVLPTIPVQRTQAGVAAGVDEVL